MFNPFDLRGPQFLLFYVVLATVAYIAASLWLRRRFNGYIDPSVSSLLRDPYKLAYLRGGAKELLSIALFGLSERKLISENRQLVRRTGDTTVDMASNEIERQVLICCSQPIPVYQLVDDSHLLRLARRHAKPLEHAGMITSTDNSEQQWPAFFAVTGSLLAIGLIKVLVAFNRGHHNVSFLFFLMVIVTVVGLGVFSFRRTPVGNQLLGNHQTLFAQLRNRIHRLANSGATNEALIVAAVFGLGVLSASKFPFAQQILRNRVKPSNSGGSSDSGSSCGSSSSSSCGGGCGGCGS